MALSPMWLAFRAVKEGISANAGLAMAREAGLGIRRDTWLKMVGAAKLHYSQMQQELDRPLNRRPSGTEKTPIPSGVAKGYIQYVDVWVRNKTTGLVYQRPQAFRVDRLQSRQAMVDKAVDRYRSAVDRSKTAPAQWGTDPDEVIVGGIYTATHEFTPEE